MTHRSLERSAPYLGPECGRVRSTVLVGKCRVGKSRVGKSLDVPSRLFGIALLPRRKSGVSFSSPSQGTPEWLWRKVLPDQDLVLHIPNLHKSFERSQADVGIGREGQGIAHRTCGGHLGPDLGGGSQVPKSQSPGHSPCDQALLIREQLAGKDTIPRVLGKSTYRQYTLQC